MKLLLAIGWLALPLLCNAAPVRTCVDQYRCISFTVTPVAGDLCGDSDPVCLAEVCLVIDLDDEDCIKEDDGAISHVCDGSGLDGCPREPVALDTGEIPTCPAITGQGDGSDFKCPGPDGLQMCQKGIPGEDLVWVIKDGTNQVSEATTFTEGDEDCLGKVSCSYNSDGNDLKCGGQVSGLFAVRAHRRYRRQSSPQHCWFWLPPGTI